MCVLSDRADPREPIEPATLFDLWEDAARLGRPNTVLNFVPDTGGVLVVSTTCLHMASTASFGIASSATGASIYRCNELMLAVGECFSSASRLARQTDCAGLAHREDFCTIPLNSFNKSNVWMSVCIYQSSV